MTWKTAALMLALCVAADGYAAADMSASQASSGWPVYRAPTIVLAHLSEENVPGGETAAPATKNSGANTQTAPANGAASSSNDGDWEEVPSGGGDPRLINGAAETATEPAAADSESPPTTASGASGPEPQPASDKSGSAPAAAQAKAAPSPAGDNAATDHAANTSGSASNDSVAPSQPGAQATDAAAQASPPPALDLSVSGAIPSLTDASLEPEIRKAVTPSMAASMRLTEEARKEFAAGNSDDALRQLGRAVSIDGGNPFAYYYLGRISVTKKNCQQAVTFLTRAEIGFNTRPDWQAETESFEGVCYEELGKLPEAERAYKSALAKSPNNVMARAGDGRLGASLAPPAALDASAPGTDESTAAPGDDTADQPAPDEAPPRPPPVPAASHDNNPNPPPDVN